MEIVSFLNKGFFENSAYFILLAVSLVYILVNANAGTRAKQVALYTVLCLVLIIWNPILAPAGLLFFGEDLWAYLRIFYIIPVMALIAYAGTLFYTEHVREQDAWKRKIAFISVIVITIVVSGATLPKTMYQKAANIYKINEDALQVSDIIRADCAGEHVVAWVPGTDEMVYGIRQYMGCIEIGGDSNTLEDEESLQQTLDEQEFSYLVLPKDTTVLAEALGEYFTLTGESDNFEVYKRTGEL